MTIEELTEQPTYLQDVVVVIDVIRAFTTAAILLARGAVDILCVADAAQAAIAAEAGPTARLQVGEHLHRPTAVVDIPNSPLAALAAHVQGQSLILFTTNGTRGLLRTRPRTTVLAGAVVNSAATAEWILANRPGADVRLVVTDPTAPEDRLCADYLAAFLNRRTVDVARTRALVLASLDAHAQLWGTNVSQHYWRGFVADVDICARVDAVPVVLVGTHDDQGRVLLRRSEVTERARPSRHSDDRHRA